MAERANRPRILCVDDEPDVLEGLIDQLHRRFEVHTARSAAEGLAKLGSGGPFAVVMSDMRMPGMNGAEFLEQVHRVAPDTTRVLLTGHADIETAIYAVNRGHVFRFLSKPCPPVNLRVALDDCVEQYRMITDDRALMQRKLLALNENLGRAERLATLGTLASAVGHEMNNILALLSLCRGEVDDAAQRGQPPGSETLQELATAERHLRAHASNLLNLGRPKAREIREWDLNEIVRDTARVMGDLGVTKQAHVALSLDACPQYIDADRTELEQILMNLLKNAVDAIEARRGGGRIQISVHGAADGFVSCSIRDNGCGIDPRQLESIFDAYYTTKGPERGTGLGLCVVKQIATAHGGDVSASSTVGLGTTFRLLWPVAARQSPPMNATGS